MTTIDLTRQPHEQFRGEAERLASAWLDKYAYGDDAVLARCEELVHAVAERCATIAGQQWQIDGSATAAEFAAEIRQAFGLTASPSDAPPQTGQPAAESGQ